MNVLLGVGLLLCGYSCVLPLLSEKKIVDPVEVNPSFRLDFDFIARYSFGLISYGLSS